MSIDCIFCKIIKGEIDSAKIWEDEEFLAILDINPNVKGATLVMTKKHYPANFFDLADEICEKFIIAAKKVAFILKKGLNVKKVGMIIEGMGVNHSHIKLYPIYRIEDWSGKSPEQKVFFEKYEGYLTSQLGHQIPLEELKKLAEQIKINGMLSR